MTLINYQFDSSMNQYRLFFIQTSTISSSPLSPPPAMVLHLVLLQLTWHTIFNATLNKMLIVAKVVVQLSFRRAFTYQDRDAWRAKKKVMLWDIFTLPQ